MAAGIPQSNGQEVALAKSIRRKIEPERSLGDGIPANHQETEYLSITHSHVPSFWRRATSEVTVPSRLRVEVRARSPQMSAGSLFFELELSFFRSKPRNLEFSKKLVNGLFATQERSTANVDYRVWLERRRQ